MTNPRSLYFEKRQLSLFIQPKLWSLMLKHYIVTIICSPRHPRWQPTAPHLGCGNSVVCGCVRTDTRHKKRLPSLHASPLAVETAEKGTVQENKPNYNPQELLPKWCPFANDWRWIMLRCNKGFILKMLYEDCARVIILYLPTKLLSSI